MQPVVEPVRDHLTAAQVRAIIQDTEAVTISGGMELVDLDLNVIEDISDDLQGGRVERQAYADMHGSASFKLRRRLDWGQDLVRPFIVLGDGTNEARFNLGVYHPSAPVEPLNEDVPTFDVQGYDILLRLRQKVANAYGIAAGTPYLDKVEEILLARGYTRFVIDPAAASVVSPTSRAWAFDGELTWMGLVNDLLSAVGYQGIYSDWDGQLRCHAYTLPLERTPEWYYSDDPQSTMLSTMRSISRDYFETPNRWVVWRSNLVEGATPVEGNGKYTYINQSNGDTSVDARGGLVITRPEQRDVADQASLVAETLKLAAADMEVPTSIPVETFINPLHWHFDRLYLTDARGIPAADVMCTKWAIPLPPDRGDMAQEWRVLA